MVLTLIKTSACPSKGKSTILAQVYVSSRYKIFSEPVCRYEDLKTQLQAAQEAALAEDDEAELARATAAVARLTAPTASLTELQIEAAEDYAGTLKINGRPMDLKNVRPPPPFSSIRVFSTCYCSFLAPVNYLFRTRPLVLTEAIACSNY